MLMHVKELIARSKKVACIKVTELVLVCLTVNDLRIHFSGIFFRQAEIAPVTKITIIYIAANTKMDPILGAKLTDS